MSKEYRRLGKELRRQLRGEVRFDDGSRALYATDSSNYRQVPIGVVLPADDEDIIRSVALARKFDAPILVRGGGTSLAGQCCNTALVLDLSKYCNRIVSLDPDRRIAHVQPGIVLDTLRNAAEQHRLTFGPDPATHSRCTIGGMIGNNSCGVHSVHAGKTDDNVEELEILTYGGQRMWVGAEEQGQPEAGAKADIYAALKSLRDRYGRLIRQRFPDIPRRVSGYNINYLLPDKGFHVARSLVGSEGTCALVLSAKLKLVKSPSFRTLVVVAVADPGAAGDHVPVILEHKPIGLEGFDDVLVEAMRKKKLLPENLALLPPGGCWLLVEFGGDSPSEANYWAELMAQEFGKSAPLKLVKKPAEQKMIWKVRESALGATAHVPGEHHKWEGWEDSAVRPDKLGAYLRDLRQLMNRYQYHGSFYGHFGDGCVHTRIDFDLVTREGIRNYRSFVEDAANLVLRYGGSFSGEHGDGQSRGELLPKMFGEELMEAFREFRKIWDPDGRMNPGKLLDAYKLDENLRLGTGYRPPTVKTVFGYQEDGGDFASATLRCVGVGECRRLQGGVMCPSYMTTLEEKHSTRGRARLLFEMLQSDVLKNGWRSHEVKEALDLCLACKGCRIDCPVRVDMATYKAEFFYHYYKERIRPTNAYTMGLIYWWARMASHLPGLANFFMHNPLTAPLAKALGGISQKRAIPRFADQTFRAWFRKRANAAASNGQPRVMLWPDTFNNFFTTAPARAAVEVLQAAGYRVDIPRKVLCCGRPLYDFGMLDLAKSLLVEIMETLREEIEAGTPIVGLEPSCVAVFRDELPNLFPHNRDALRLSKQTFTLAEFLAGAGYEPPRINRKAITQVHCHHHAVLGFDSERALLSKMGLKLEVPDSGCCGMAGSFGFKSEHYKISQACGERLILPMVRAASDDTLIIADGFSCREQILQGTGRQPLHLAEVLRLGESS